jgi:hypothetical protein
MFFKPDNFRDNPYGYLTNQISHVAVSFVYSLLVTRVGNTFGVIFSGVLVIW